ncbi:MAG: tRNA (5-methylaminomethyl-2-thiouridine)(34)-methyltransferase MnmD [Tangfeifania sp.]
MKQQILKKTADGSFTIYLPEMGEQYHSMNGAITESNHVFIEKGYLFNKEINPSVFEVGFGTGLNCLLTILQAQKFKRPTVYYSVEKYPLSIEVAQKLDYGSFFSDEACTWFGKIHSCPWKQEIQISEYFRLCKLKTDLAQAKCPESKKFDVIYFDAFGPDKQPQMWTPDIFGKIAGMTKDTGVFVTYSAKGQVRRDLTTAGYKMERLPGPPGKKQMLRGIKVDSNLQLPKN